jgi:hypothetical protein
MAKSFVRCSTGGFGCAADEVTGKPEAFDVAAGAVWVSETAPPPVFFTKKNSAANPLNPTSTTAATTSRFEREPLILLGETDAISSVGWPQ